MDIGEFSFFLTIFMAEHFFTNTPRHKAEYLPEVSLCVLVPLWQIIFRGGSGIGGNRDE